MLPENVDWAELEKIISFARKLQTEYSQVQRLAEKKSLAVAALINICRRCTDVDCPGDCEVKKAYDVINIVK